MIKKNIYFVAFSFFYFNLSNTVASENRCTSFRQFGKTLSKQFRKTLSKQCEGKLSKQCEELLQKFHLSLKKLGDNLDFNVFNEIFKDIALQLEEKQLREKLRLNYKYDDAGAISSILDKKLIIDQAKSYTIKPDPKQKKELEELLRCYGEDIDTIIQKAITKGDQSNKIDLIQKREEPNKTTDWHDEDIDTIIQRYNYQQSYR